MRPAAEETATWWSLTRGASAGLAAMLALKELEGARIRLEGEDAGAERCGKHGDRPDQAADIDQKAALIGQIADGSERFRFPTAFSYLVPEAVFVVGYGESRPRRW